MPTPCPTGRKAETFTAGGGLHEGHLKGCAMNKQSKSSGVQDYFATKEAQELKKLIEENLKANAHHEKAIGILKEAIQAAAFNTALTPEVKELADMLIFLIEDRSVHDYTFDGIMEPLVKIVKKDTKSESGKNGAKYRHAESYELHNRIKVIWASGKYSSRDVCAEQEYSGLGFGSFKAARNALTNTPDPSPWPGKNAKK